MKKSFQKEYNLKVIVITFYFIFFLINEVKDKIMLETNLKNPNML